MSQKSTRSGRSRKAAPVRPKKPYAEFPLSPHPSGAWQKKIRSKIHYFGWWGHIVNGKMVCRPDGGAWKEALEIYKSQADDLHAGRKPRVKGGGLTVGELRGRFLTVKSRALDAGEITGPTYVEYRATTDRLFAFFSENRLVEDLAADDFEALRADIARRFGPVRLGNEITRIKSVFKYGFEAGLIDRPVRLGPAFRKPSASVLRRHRAKNDNRMLEAAELRCLLNALAGKEVTTGRANAETGELETVTFSPNPALRAMVLLGVNCGFNNKDCADSPLTALDLDGAWINFPRPKTGIARRCSLWPETMESLRTAIAIRPESRKDDAKGLVFVTTRGRPWLSRRQANPVSVAARDIRKAIGAFTAMESVSPPCDTFSEPSQTARGIR